MDDSTLNFRAARPYSVLSISPGLAALYASQDVDRPGWCTRCGSYLFDGASEARLVRVKSSDQRSSFTRVLRRTCKTCGQISDELAIESLGSGLQQNLPPPSVATSALQGSPKTEPALPQQQKGRSKTRSALEILLSQSRERTVHAKPAVADSSGSGSLAAFLSGL